MPPTTDVMQIYVRLLTGKTLTIDVEADETFASVKAKIHASEGYPPDQQRLIFEGQEREDDSTLADCGIIDKTTIHCVLRLRGD
jgi:Ubiquitin family